MQNKTVPNIKKAVLDKAVAELEELETEIAAKSRRRDELRTKMADIFHKGEDGTDNTEIHGYEIKIVRRLDVKCDAEAAEQLNADHPDIYKQLFKKKTTVTFDKTSAKKRLDEIEDYVTTKQGLPSVTIKRIK